MADFDIWIGGKNLDSFDWRAEGVTSDDNNDDDNLIKAADSVVAMIGFDPFGNDLDTIDEAGVNDYHLFHVTSSYKAYSIVKSMELRLPLSATNRTERSLGTPRPYYMSFARGVSSGYIADRGEGNGLGGDVLLIFDSRKLLNTRGTELKTIDYWATTSQNKTGRQMGRGREMEERLFSDKPKLDITNKLAEIRVMVDDNDWRDSWKLELVIDAKKKKIKLKLFTKNNTQGFIAGREKVEDRKNALEILKKHGPTKVNSNITDAMRGGTLRKRASGYGVTRFQLLNEFVNKKTFESLSKDAKERLSSIFYSATDDDAFLRGYETDLHNMRSGRTTEQDQFNKVFLSSKEKNIDVFFRKLTIKWRKLRKEYLAEEDRKWREKYAREEAEKDAADPERVRLRELRKAQEAEVEARYLANQKSIWGDSALAVNTKLNIDNLALKMNFKMGHPQGNLFSYKFQVMDGSKIVAKLFLDSTNNEDFNIDIMDGSSDGVSGSQENSLGANGLKKILSLLRKEIPTLKTIKGYRSTGIRGKTGKKGITRAFNVDDIAASKKLTKKSASAFKLVAKNIDERFAGKKSFNGKKITHDDKVEYGLNLLNKVYDINTKERDAVYVAIQDYCRTDTAGAHSFTGDPQRKGELAGVYYDQRDGLGNVPDGANIEYKGFAVIMTAKTFLKCVPPRADDLDDEGSKLVFADTGIGSPFLRVDFSVTPPKVKGHEGRGRAKAIAKIKGEKTPMLVHIFPAGGERARHLTPEMLIAFSRSIGAEKSSDVVRSPIAPKIYYMGQWQQVSALAKSDTAEFTDTALIKPSSDYRWYTYKGGRALKFPFTRGRTTKEFTLQPGEKFGIRSASSTVGSRVILEKLGERYVFTPMVDKVRLLLRMSTSTENKVEDKEKSGAVDHVTSIKAALNKATVDKNKVTFFKLQDNATGEAWRLLARWMSLHAGVNISGEQLYAYEKMRHLLNADKVTALKNPKPLTQAVVAGAKAVRAIYGRLPKEKELARTLSYIRALKKGTRNPAAIEALRTHDRLWSFNGKSYTRNTK